MTYQHQASAPLCVMTSNNVGLQEASTKQSLPLLTAEFLSPGEVIIFTQGKTLALKVAVFVCLQVKGGNFQSSATDRINCLPLLECECEVAESS